MLDSLVSSALEDFTRAAELAGASTPRDQIHALILKKPHKASTLPRGRVGVYAFFLNGRALKVGKVGANSGPRFTYQHYTGSAMSTLCGSILANQAKVGANGLDIKTAGEWIKSNTDRVEILMPENFGIPILSLLEAFLHVRWNPLFEGRD
jgi:hypothetical protein